MYLHADMQKVIVQIQSTIAPDFLLRWPSLAVGDCLMKLALDLCTCAAGGVLLILTSCTEPNSDSASDSAAASTSSTTGDDTTTDGDTTSTTGEPTTSTTTTTTTTTGPEEPEVYGEWVKREPEGAICSDGSQFKFFVNFAEDSDNLLVYFEPGGACWDFETCSGNTPLGAANPNGIPDTHMDKYGVLSPILSRVDPQNPSRDWNLVFIPYCTGDVHTGNRVMTYDDPEGVREPLVYHHNGHDNVSAVIDYLGGQFPQIDRMMLTGCSAGGTGSIINYHFFRERLQVERAYLLNDSGPIFPSSGFSAPLHQKIRSSWDVDPILETIPEGNLLADDFGKLNSILANLYPEDRLTTAYFKRDFNYSRYSYESFYPNPSKEQTLDYWAQDTTLLTAQYDQFDNLAYYIPYWRGINDSHCTGIITYEGTEIQEMDMDLSLFIDELLDDSAPLTSYEESDQPGEDL